MIPYGRQDISGEDVQAVVDVLRSEYLTQGPAVPQFENAVADACGARHAVAVNSATSALHLACLALGVGPGNRVWTSPITFVASANCALYCGASVDFVDIDPRTWNMSAECLSVKLEDAESRGQLPKVIIPVHLTGQPCEMAAIHRLAKRYGCRVIEDASHAIGARYEGQPIGDCRYSDIVVFSFHPVKIVTTGEGGVAVTNNDEYAWRMRLMRSHGITRDPADMVGPSHGPWYYQQVDLGFNYRMTDIHAALGLSQMTRMTDFVERRRALARRYDEILSNLPVVTPWQHPDSNSAYHLYVVRLALGEIPRTHLEVFTTMRAAGIGVNLHYIPVYRHPYYERLGFRRGYCTEAEAYYAEAISLPMYAGLTMSQQDQVVEALAVSCGS